MSAATSLLIATGLAGLAWGAKPPLIKRIAAQQTLRIFGIVQDASGQPLAGISVRWIPASAGRLGFHTHDLQVVGEKIDLQRLSESPLHEALKQSVMVRTGVQGRYELQLERPQKAGVVVATGPGYATLLEEILLDDLSLAEADREWSFRMAPGGRIAGAVLESVKGAPAAGAVVEATPVQMDRPAFYTSMQKQFASMVNEDGSYALEGLPAGVYRVRPVTGYSNFLGYSVKQGAQAVVQSGGAAKGIDFEVQPGGTIRGRVRGPDGQTLAGVRLRAKAPLDSRSWSEMLDRPTTLSRAQGEFEIRGLPLGEVYRLHASGPGFAQALGEWIELLPNNPEAEVEVSLDEGYSISGQVRFEGGEPASGYRVRAFPTETDYRFREAQADESGAFVLSNLPPVGFKLQASPPNVSSIIRSGPQIIRVEIEGSDLSGLEVVALNGPAHRLAGQVVDDRGQAVAEAWIQVASGQGEWSLKSGPDGHFVVDGLSKGEYVVTAQKAGHSQAALQDVAPGRDNLIVALERSGWVSGRIIAAGASAPGSPGQVEAVPEGLNDWDYQRWGGREGWRGQSLSDGSFRIQAPAGRIEIRAAVPGYPPAASSPFELEPGEEASEILIPLLPAGRVYGQVNGADGRPVEDAEISMLAVEAKMSEQSARWRLMQGNFAAERHRARSDAQGRFDLPGLAPGDYWLLANHSSLVPSELRAVAVARGEAVEVPDLVLEPGGVISGQLSDGAPGVAGIGVQLMGMGDNRQAVTDSEGLFHFEGVLPGSYHLYVKGISDFRQGIRNAVARSINVTSRQTLEVDIDYQEGGRLYGSVFGLPAAAPHSISLTPAERPVRFPRTQSTLRPDGSYDVRGIEPGRYLVEVSSTHRKPLDSPASVQLSFTRHCSLALEIRQGDTPLNIDLAAEPCRKP